MAVEKDRQLIESGMALAQGLLTAHNRLSTNASLCSQLEKTMHIRKLSLSKTHTHLHSYPAKLHLHKTCNRPHTSIITSEIIRKMSCSIYHRIVLRWKMYTWVEACQFVTLHTFTAKINTGGKMPKAIYFNLKTQSTFPANFNIWWLTPSVGRWVNCFLIREISTDTWVSDRIYVQEPELRQRS